MRQVSIGVCVILLFGCAVSGTLVSSQGEILGWTRSGYGISIQSDDIVFVAHNSYYSELETVGLAQGTDLDSLQASRVGAKPFVIESRWSASTIEGGTQFEALLEIGAESIPSDKVVTGTFDISTGCIASTRNNDNRTEDLGEYLEETSTCILFHFDIPTPPPEQELTLTLVIMSGPERSTMDIRFTPTTTPVYYN